MEGEPLDYVKRAAGHVVDLLEPTDVLSIVTFAEQVDVVMPALRVLNKSLIKDHIQRIQTANTTNLYDGLVVGGQQVASIPSHNYLNRILLLTDGEPTAGIKDFASIVGLVAEQKVVPDLAEFATRELDVLDVGESAIFMLWSTLGVRPREEPSGDLFIEVGDPER